MASPRLLLLLLHFSPVIEILHEKKEKMKERKRKKKKERKKERKQKRPKG